MGRDRLWLLACINLQENMNSLLLPSGKKGEIALYSFLPCLPWPEEAQKRGWGAPFERGSLFGSQLCISQLSLGAWGSHICDGWAGNINTWLVFEPTGWNGDGQKAQVQDLKQRNNTCSHKEEERWAEKGVAQIVTKSYLTCSKTLIAGNGQPVGWYFISTNRFLQDTSHISLRGPQEFIKY